MPCKCRLPIEEYPEASEWGPILWSLLHGLAEHAGRPVTPLYAEDERHNWLQFFRQTGEIIPCPTCKEHYIAYLKENPVDALKTMHPEEFREWIRTWFWDIHQWVNEQLEKPSFPKESLSPTYASLALRQRLRHLDAPLRKAITLSGQNAKKFQDWKSRYLMLLSIFGL